MQSLSLQASICIGRLLYLFLIFNIPCYNNSRGRRSLNNQSRWAGGSKKDTMRIITIAVRKGGVGKTTLAYHLGRYAAEKGHKTCLIDFDDQGNLSSLFDYSGGLKAVDLFTDADAAADTVRPNLDLVPGNDALSDQETQGLRTILEARPRIRGLAKHYDLTVIDTPPGSSGRLVLSLAAANYVISPMTMDRFSKEGVENLLQYIAAIRRQHNPGMKFLGLVPNMVMGRSAIQIKELRALQTQLGGLVIQGLNHRAAIGAAIDSGRAVWELPQTRWTRIATAEVRATLDEILRRMGLQ